MDEYTFSDEEYGKVLDNFAIGCVDVAVWYQGKILLERREKNPALHKWWIFGGRMLKGDSFTATAQRSVERELGLTIDESRFIQLGTYSLVWPMRREPPETNGCHHILIAHGVELNDEEYQVATNHLLSQGINAQWFAWGEVKGDDFPPEIQDMCQDLSKRQ